MILLKLVHNDTNKSVGNVLRIRQDGDKRLLVLDNGSELELNVKNRLIYRLEKINTRAFEN